MAKPTLAISHSFDLQTRLELGLVTEILSEGEIAAEAQAQTEILLIRTDVKVTAKLLEAYPRLRLIVSCTAGFDHIDLKACEARGVLVAHTPLAHVRSAAEHTWAMILACQRKIPQAHRQVKSGQWRDESLRGSELSGKSLGLVGLGRIGKRVARIARAFDMSIYAYDPYLNEADFTEASAERVGFEELIKLSDILSFHCPLTDETRNLLHASHFEYIRRGIVLVNCARGELIKEADLAKALQAGWVGAAALDVFNKEPLPRNSPLLGLDNVLLSPHLGAATVEAKQASCREALELVRAYCTDELPREKLLPPSAPWYGARKAFSD